LQKNCGTPPVRGHLNPVPTRPPHAPDPHQCHDLRERMAGKTRQNPAGAGGVAWVQIWFKRPTGHAKVVKFRERPQGSTSFHQWFLYPPDPLWVHKCYPGGSHGPFEQQVQA
jgi:hypothetical protein